MRTILAVLLALFSWPAAADNPLRGQWEMKVDGHSNQAVMLIDAEGRATYDSPSDGGRPAKYLGYVRNLDGKGGLHAIFTNRDLVAHMFCRIQSSDLLTCYFARAESPSVPFKMVRVGPGPYRLTAP